MFAPAIDSPFRVTGGGGGQIMGRSPTGRKPAVARLADIFRLRPELLGGLGRALSSRDYRLYACGHVAHVHGWWGNKLGLGWLTWELTGSAGWLGIVAFAAMIPVTLIAPFGGALADRHGHRRMALIAGGAGCIATAAIAVFALSGSLTMPLLLSLAVLQGALFGIEFPARQALIPQLVGRENIPAAVAFNSTTFQVGAFIGPVLAGALITGFGAGAAVGLFAFTTLWMAAMMLLIRHRNPLSPERAAAGILDDIMEGFRYLAGNRALRLLLLMPFTSGLLLRPYVDLLPGFADEVFRRGAEGLAQLNAAAGLGAFSLALVLLYRSRVKGLATTMMAGAVLAPVGLVLFAATDRFDLALVVLFVSAMLMLATHVSAYSLVQSMIAPAMRGRVIAINAAISIGAPALGALLMGQLAELAGLQPAIAITAVAAFIVVICLLPAMRRHAPEMEADPEA